jgi:hypothetical protein
MPENGINKNMNNLFLPPHLRIGVLHYNFFVLGCFEWRCCALCHWFCMDFGSSLICHLIKSEFRQALTFKNKTCEYSSIEIQNKCTYMQLDNMSATYLHLNCDKMAIWS